MLADWSHAQPATAVVALVTAWVALRPPAWTRRLPNYLVGLLVGTTLYYALRAVLGDAALGPVLGRLEPIVPGADLLVPLRRTVGEVLWVDHVGGLLRFSFAVALITSLQGLLASSVIDGLTRTRRDGERQLLAQGAANVAVGLIGGLPVAGAVSRSKINLDSGGTGRLSVLAFGLTLLLAVTLGSPVLRHLPLAVVAGLFLVAAFSLVDPWSRSATVTLVRGLGTRRASGSLLQNYAVMLLVASVSALISIAYGVALGVLLAMFAFVRSHSRHPVRSVVYADQRHSLKVRTSTSAALLHAHGHRIALIELDGALFFGTSDTVAREIERVAKGAEQVIVDFRRVTDIDASGARVLVQAVDALRAAGKRLLLASLDAGDARAVRIREMDTHQGLSAADFFADGDRALESAEDRLLGSFGKREDAQTRLRLQDTMLGARLDPTQIGCLEAVLVERRFDAGQAIFRQGEPSDAMFVSVQGEVGIWLPGDKPAPDRRGRRVVSFAPGVVFGEMGLLQNQPRSADAVAEDDDTVVLELSRAALARLAGSEHALLASIMLNLTRHLADRLRAQTNALQAVLDNR
jgi:SulP family sulfate permease